MWSLGGDLWGQYFEYLGVKINREVCLESECPDCWFHFFYFAFHGIYGTFNETKLDRICDLINDIGTKDYEVIPLLKIAFFEGK